MDSITLLFHNLFWLFVIVALLFLSTGITHVNSGYVVYISKRGKLVKIWGEGFHFSFPWRYDISKEYPYEEFTVELKDESNLYSVLTLKIEDHEKFFYRQIEVPTMLENYYKEFRDSNKFRETAEKELSASGVEILEVEIKRRERGD